jgi:hypothetical protein
MSTSSSFLVTEYDSLGFCSLFYVHNANFSKGDERRPECKRCEKAGRSCFFSEEPRPSNLDGTALGNSDYFVFPEDQLWVNVPPTGEYIGNGVFAVC